MGVQNRSFDKDHWEGNTACEYPIGILWVSCGYKCELELYLLLKNLELYKKYIYDTRTRNELHKCTKNCLHAKRSHHHSWRSARCRSIVPSSELLKCLWLETSTCAALTVWHACESSHKIPLQKQLPGALWLKNPTSYVQWASCDHRIRKAPPHPESLWTLWDHRPT